MIGGNENSCTGRMAKQGDFSLAPYLSLGMGKIRRRKSMGELEMRENSSLPLLFSQPQSISLSISLEAVPTRAGVSELSR